MKKIVSLLACAFLGTLVFAYNPPVGGESVYRITQPDLLADSASATGGPLFNVVPASITYNPALTALNQRILIDASYTALVDTNPVNTTAYKFGSGFQLGALFPTKWCVPSVTVQGVFSPFPEMNTGNSILVHGGVSKDITDHVFVGVNLYTGFYFGSGSDFTVGADLGTLFVLDDLGFLKQPRIGVSIMNLGKPLTGNYEVIGLDGTTTDVNYPGIVTPHVSFGATLFDVKKIKGGFSADVSAPFCQNMVFNTGLGFSFFDIVKLSVGWEANLRELLDGAQFNMPSVGLGVNFSFNSKKMSEKNADWEKSEMHTSVAWQQLYGGVQAISGGVSLKVGAKDTTAPQIILWDGEE